MLLAGGKPKLDLIRPHTIVREVVHNTIPLVGEIQMMYEMIPK